MATPQISGYAVAVATVGGLLAYAGVRGVSPAVALREISTGKASAIPRTGATWSTPTSVGGTVGRAIGVSIVAAARKHSGERYSQSRRWQIGYSDCSSFVGKALKDSGITPPTSSTTAAYAVWSGATRIDRSSVGPGDLVLVPGVHIVIATGSDTGIGQQNARRNVQEGPLSSLIDLRRAVYLRVKGGAA